MVCVSVEIREGDFTRRVWISAPSVERALEIAGEGKPRRGVRLLFPIDAEAFFGPDGSDDEASPLRRETSGVGRAHPGRQQRRGGAGKSHWIPGSLQQQ